MEIGIGVLADFSGPLNHACSVMLPKILAGKPKFSHLAHSAQPNAVVASRSITLTDMMERKCMLPDSL